MQVERLGVKINGYASASSPVLVSEWMVHRGLEGVKDVDENDSRPFLVRVWAREQELLKAESMSQKLL